jgi:hypothetical protein
MPWTPAGNNSQNLPQALVIHYDKNFRRNLKAQTPFVACCEGLELPMHSGNQYRIYQYDPLAADTNQVQEGAPGSSETIGVVSTTFTIGEFGDYLNFSSLVAATAIDNTIENCGIELSYQLGETLSSIVRTVADGAHTTDSSVQVQLAASSTSAFTTLSLSAIRNQVQSLAGRSVKPFNEAKKLFRGVIHPFALGDVAADNSNNSPLDLLKHSGSSGLDWADELVSTDLEEWVEIPTSGVEFAQSNLVTQTSNYKSVTGLTSLRTYIFGQDAIFRVKLDAPNTEAIDDGMYQNLMCGTYQNVAPSVADAVGLIPGWTKYHVFFTAGQSPDPIQRLRTIDAGTAVS